MAVEHQDMRNGAAVGPRVGAEVPRAPREQAGGGGPAPRAVAPAPARPRAPTASSREAPALPGDILLNRVAAVVLWGAAVWTTWLLVASLNPTAPVWLNIAIAVGCQLIMTRMERPALQGRRSTLSWVVLGFDGMINAGGLFPVMLRAGETPPARMIIAAFQLQPDVSAMAALFLALALGFVLAAAPEAVWHWEE